MKRTLRGFSFKHFQDLTQVFYSGCRAQVSRKKGKWKITIDKFKQLPDLKAGYEDKYFSAILSTGDLKKYEFSVTKGTDANTLIGVKTDFGDNYKIGFEHVLSDSSELKLGVSNKDLLDIQYVKVSVFQFFIDFYNYF